MQHIRKLQRWDESQHPREPAGGPGGGQFTGDGGGGEGGGGGGDKPSGGGKAKAEKVSDFSAKGIRLDHDTTLNPAKAEKFLQRWNERVQEAPEDFKQAFLGGMQGTMGIDYNDATDNIIVSGNLQDDGKNIGEYQREIDLKNNKAYSAYFVMKKAERGGGVGKQLLAANVAMYQKMGLDHVAVSANIDVGGYAWAKYGYVPTAESWRRLSTEIRDKLNEQGDRASHTASGSGYTPDEWDSISSDDQSQIETAWMRSTHEEFLDSEIQNWRDSGGALDDAKSNLADNYAGYQDDWAKATIKLWREDHPDISLSDQNILDSVKISYDRDGEGRNDPDIEIDDASLNALEESSQGQLPGMEQKPSDKLPDDARQELIDALTKEFNSHAEDEAQELDPPSVDVSDYQEYWDTMDDSAKYDWASRNGELPEYPIEDDDEEAHPGPVEADDPQRAALLKLASSSDPKALWAIADSEQGKDLLLGTSWSGVINFKDKQTMDRFHSYVGKGK